MVRLSKAFVIGLVTGEIRLSMVFVIGFSTSSILVAMLFPILPRFLASGFLAIFAPTFPSFDPAAPRIFPPPRVRSSRA